MEKFKKRAVKYLDIIEFGDWKFKLYTLKYNEFRVTPEIENVIKAILPDWIKENSQINDFPNYKIGTVIVHEAMDSILVVVNWWVYENVIQNHVYCSEFWYSNNHKGHKYAQVIGQDKHEEIFIHEYPDQILIIFL